MNEQLQTAIADLIEKSLTAFQKGADFLSAELPEVIHQLLLWKMVSSAVGCAVGVLIIIGSVVWLVYQWKYWTTVIDTIYGERMRIESDAGPFCFLNIFVFIPIVFGSLLLNLTWLKIWLAPKVWLIEYAATLVGVKK